MIIDTTKHKRRLLDLKSVSESKLLDLGVSPSKEVLEFWSLGNDEFHIYGFSSDIVSKLGAAGAIHMYQPNDTKRACNNCGRFLEDTKKQQAFGRLYKCPGCSVAWWGKPTSLPANAETRNARRLTANMMKLVKELAPLASLKHDVRPLGCLNLQECRVESIKLTDLNASENKRRAIIFQASQLGILNNADQLMAEQLVEGLKEPQDLYDDLAPGWLTPKPVAQSVGMLDPAFCPHNWDFSKDICKLCGITKEALMYGMRSPVKAKETDPKQPARLIDLE